MPQLVNLDQQMVDATRQAIDPYLRAQREAQAEQRLRKRAAEQNRLATDRELTLQRNRLNQQKELANLDLKNRQDIARINLASKQAAARAEQEAENQRNLQVARLYLPAFDEVTSQLGSIDREVAALNQDRSLSEEKRNNRLLELDARRAPLLEQRSSLFKQIPVGAQAAIGAELERRQAAVSRKPSREEAVSLVRRGLPVPGYSQEEIEALAPKTPASSITALQSIEQDIAQAESAGDPEALREALSKRRELKPLATFQSFLEDDFVEETTFDIEDVDQLEKYRSLVESLSPEERKQVLAPAIRQLQFRKVQLEEEVSKAGREDLPVDYSAPYKLQRFVNPKLEALQSLLN